MMVRRQTRDEWRRLLSLSTLFKLPRIRKQTCHKGVFFFLELFNRHLDNVPQSPLPFQNKKDTGMVEKTPPPPPPTNNDSYKTCIVERGDVQTRDPLSGARRTKAGLKITVGLFHAKKKAKISGAQPD